MGKPALQAKAESILRRRHEKGVAYYYRTQWQRQLIFASLYALLIAAAWYLVGPLLAAGIFGFWMGKFIRDLQWYSRLASEWETTVDLIDWPRVELLAADRNIQSLSSDLQ